MCVCIGRYTTTRVASMPIARDSKCRPNFSDNGESDEVKWKIFEDRRRRASMPKSCMTSRAPRMYRNIGSSACDPNLGTRLTHLFRPSPSSFFLPPVHLPSSPLARLPSSLPRVFLSPCRASLLRRTLSDSPPPVVQSFFSLSLSLAHARRDRKHDEVLSPRKIRELRVSEMPQSGVRCCQLSRARPAPSTPRGDGTARQCEAE